MFKRILTKLGILAVILSLPLVGGTNSAYSDVETSAGNNLAAATLDFSLKNSGDSLLVPPLFNISGMKPGDSGSKLVKLAKEGSLDFIYDLSEIPTSGDIGLCSALQVEAKLDGTTKYTGSLSALHLDPEPTITGPADEWTFVLGLSDSADNLQNKTCNFDLQITGWQVGSDGSWGLTSKKSLGNAVSTGVWPDTSLSLSADQHTISFVTNHITFFKRLSYQLTYDTDTVPEGFNGSFDLNGDASVHRDFPLETCSTDGCSFQTGAHNFILHITLTNSANQTTDLSASL